MSFGRMRNRREEPGGVQAFGGRVGGTPSAARLVDPFTMFVKALRHLTVGQQGRSRTFLTWGCFPGGAIVSRGQFSRFVVGHNFASFHSRDITDFV